MKRAHYAALAGGMMALLSGCVTPPPTYEVESTAKLDRSFDDAWTDVVEFLATNNVQIKNVAKDSGVIYADKAGFDDMLADCGGSGLFMPIGRQETLNVFLRKGTDGKVSISVNTTFAERRRFESNIRDFKCNSRGVIESQIIAAAKGAHM